MSSPVSFPNLLVSGASFVPLLACISHIVLYVSCPSFLGFLSVSYISLAFLSIISSSLSLFILCLLFVSRLSPARLLPVFCPLLSASYPPLVYPHLANCLPVPPRRCVAISANKTRIKRMTFRSEPNCLTELLSRSMDDTSTPVVHTSG